MNVSAAETQALVAIFTLIVTVTPAIAIAINAYLRSKANEIQLSTKLDRGEVQSLIDDKAHEILGRTSGPSGPNPL